MILNLKIMQYNVKIITSSILKTCLLLGHNVDSHLENIFSFYDMKYEYLIIRFALIFNENRISGMLHFVSKF